MWVEKAQWRTLACQRRVSLSTERKELVGMEPGDDSYATEEAEEVATVHGTDRGGRPRNYNSKRGDA
jgi:hypothetical protein